jgi:hypothetical protein
MSFEHPAPTALVNPPRAVVEVVAAMALGTRSMLEPIGRRRRASWYGVVVAGDHPRHHGATAEVVTRSALVTSGGGVPLRSDPLPVDHDHSVGLGG